MLTYLDVSAVSEGISDNLAFYLLSIANAFSALGRIVGGLLADHTGMLRASPLSTPPISILQLLPAGPLNIMTPATFLAGIMTFIWPFAKSTGGNIGVAVVYGYVSLSNPPSPLESVSKQVFGLLLRKLLTGVNMRKG